MSWKYGGNVMKLLRLSIERNIVKTLVSIFVVAIAIAPAYAAPGDQQIVKDYIAAEGWTSIVPINVNGDGLTDFVSYNATTGRAIVSVAVGTSGDQKIVKDYIAAEGWTSIVPINVNGDGLTDFVSYNATTGRAIVSVAT